MANSRYDYQKQRETKANTYFSEDTYVIIRIDGDNFHKFCTKHNFHKPNDKRALDLMVESAKEVMRTFKGHVPLAYGYSDEFSFLIKSTSNIMTRRVSKISMLFTSIFTAYYNCNWDKYFGDEAKGNVTPREGYAYFKGKYREHPSYLSVIDFFRWRQVDCHINNLYNTTLHAMTGCYIKHELIKPMEANQDPEVTRIPISDWIGDKSKFMSSRDATDKLNGTVSADKHDILFLQYKINYNNELEQFKKGTVIVDTQRDYNGKNANSNSIQHYNLDLTKGATFWHQHKYIFDDRVIKLLPDDFPVD